MAQKIVTTYVDDLTEEESTEVTTHTILVDGAGVEIDLAPDSHDKLMEALAPFLHAGGARRVRGGGTSGARRLRAAPAKPAAGTDTAGVRAWAKEKGYEINDRGRVPAPIREAYEKAH